MTSLAAKLKPYHRMKDSGVEWLGEVPEHWAVTPGRSVLGTKFVRNEGLKENQVLSLSYGRIIVKPEEKLRGLVPESFETYQIVDPGDIIIRATDLQNDRTSLRIGQVRDRGIITSAYMCLQPRNGLSRNYGYQLLNVYDLKKILYGFGSGLRQNLDWSDFKYMPLVVSTHEEQAAIVRFIGFVDRRIRRYIRAKRKLIKLLEEQKQAIIHRAVTRGLDPDVPLKDSGVEWLDQVPEHWKVWRFKRVVRIQGGYAFPADSFGSEGTPVIRMNNIRRGFLELEDVVRIAGYQCKSAFALNVGDVVYGLSGSIGATGSLGNYAVVRSCDLPAQLNQRVARFTPIRARITQRYLTDSLQTSAFYAQVLSNTTGTAQFNVSTNDIANVALALPPIAEQRQISGHLSVVTAKMAAAITRAKREVELLNEYRTRLIADVVTGKLDVREAAATLPDEPEESETLDDPLPEIDEPELDEVPEVEPDE